MSQDDKSELWSDCDPSDATSNSLNNSLSEEEFSIQNSAPGEVASLKFKISCLKKGSNNETLSSSRTNLKNLQDSHLQYSHPQDDGNMEVKTSSDSKSLRADGGHYKAFESIPSCNSVESFQDKSVISQSCDDFPVGIEHAKWNSKNPSRACSEHLKDDHEKTLKASSKICAVNHRTSAAVDAPDAACFRMDTLPNVSPDSGIISFEGSPFGNESPSSVTGIENNHETDTLTAPMDLMQTGHKCVDSVAMGKCDSSESSVCKESQDGVKVICLEERSCTNDISIVARTENEAGPSVSDSQEERQILESESVLSTDTEKNFTTSTEYPPVAEQHIMSPHSNAHQNSPIVSDRTCKEPDDGVSQKKYDLSGTDFILSSPDKISQPAWRKKRGKKQRRKKTLLLSHKKSTLYNVENESCLTKGSNKGHDVGRPEEMIVIQMSCGETEETPIKCVAMTPEEKNAKAKKRSPGRPKGSLNRKVGDKLVKGSGRCPKAKSPINEPSSKRTGNASRTVPVEGKRPRGRPRKCPPDSERYFLPPQVSKAKIVKKKRSRKRIFTHIKKTTLIKHVPSDTESSTNNQKGRLQSSRDKSSLEPSIISLKQPPSKGNIKSLQKKGKEVKEIVKGKESCEIASVENTDRSAFQDSDFDALLQSVNSSIKMQFVAGEDNNETMNTLSFDNPFKYVQTPSFPRMTPVREGNSLVKAVKPKYKKPKLHVMMRMTKRKKKKKKKLEPSRTTVVEPIRTSAFGVSPLEKRMSFFSSCVQPPKMLALSRLNVFQSGTGVENNRSVTPVESEQESFDKRWKRKRRLLNFKSKHKNIIDPVFAAELDTMVSGLHEMTISEDLNDNFIKVRPGEMPLPTIFRVIKIDVSKKVKDRVFMPDNVSADVAKPIKSRKDPVTSETTSSFVKTSSKYARKKSSSDQTSDSKDQLSLSDTSDQWLPPKKRHRMVNIDNMISQSSPSNISNNSQETTLSLGKDIPNLCDKRKGRRPKRTGCSQTHKQGVTTCKSVEQELTIDTSSCSGPCSSFGGQTPSPCLSRLSTRSSTIPSVSSLSPTGSCSFRTRYPSKGVLLACPSHSLTVTSQEDYLSCAECQLIRQSATASPTNAQLNHPLQSSLSNQISVGPACSYLSTQLTVEPVCSSELADSSSESSPCPRLSLTKDNVIRRTSRKRLKSSPYSAEESDPSPPRLEKNCAPTFHSHTLDADLFAPPKISPTKGPSSPQRRSTYRRSQLPAKSHPVTSTSSDRSLGLTSQHKPLRQYSCRLTTSINSELKCNSSPNKSSQSSPSHSVIYDPNDSDWQPLPLKFCTKRKLVEEIQAALQSDSGSDSDSSTDGEEESQEVSYPSILLQGAASSQPPRKRYQRVGLFSDFYKDDEPRRRCESMVRCRDKLTYLREEHLYGLMPMPIHIGQHYINQVHNFKLPYDIWWQEAHQQLPKRSEPKIKFRTIKSNVYSDSKVNSRKVEHPMCNCRLPLGGGYGCLDDCLNRMIYTECSPTNCPLGTDCGNQRMQKHEWAPGIEKFLTSDRGYGVRVTKSVKAGQFLLEYLGEVISETEFRHRMMEEYSDECHHYALHLDSGTIIDGYRMGNIGRYVNHSCQPNCEMQKWNVNGLYRMVLFALRDIEPFEELVYDYNFDSFNQETQQECRCGSSDCRGVIGGKTQRTNGVNRTEKSDDSKDKRKSKLMNKKTKEKKSAEALPVLPPTKPMTYKERCYARKHRTFLLRNVDKVRNQRHPGQVFSVPKEEVGVPGKVNCVTSDLLLANLSESAVKTRLAALAKDNPEVLRRHRLAQLFDKMLTEILSLKDEDGSCMVLPLMSLPSRKKQLEYYQVVKDPIDMSMIKQRVKTGFYDHLSSFNSDVMLLFMNVELYCGHKSELGQVILKLRRIFNCVKQEMASQLDEEMGPGTTKLYLDADLEKLEQGAIKTVKAPAEDIIRCICGVTRDEGLMLQCEKCMKWQHCDCVRANGEEEHYLCDRCEPRYYDPEIPLAPNPSDALPDCTHFMTLVKDDVQYAVGDCVYVMRDCKRTATGTPLRSSHRLMATTNPDSLDVFRIEQLWKDPKGERFASGTPYLRGQETFHEPTRKFFHNELFRTPNYEIIPMDLVMGKCVVMDPNTYSKGRPKGVKEQDVYICEYRVDKTAHLFHKIKEIWYPINTSLFCFDWFDNKLFLKRTFTPHEVPEEYLRKVERSFNPLNTSRQDPVECVEKKHDVKKMGKHQILNGKVKVDESLTHDVKLKSEVKVNVKKGSLLKKELKWELGMEKPDVSKMMEVKRQEKRLRLDRLLNKLLQNIPGKQKIDLSYLLDGGRRVRKKLVK